MVENVEVEEERWQWHPGSVKPTQLRKSYWRHRPYSYDNPPINLIKVHSVFGMIAHEYGHAKGIMDYNGKTIPKNCEAIIKYFKGQRIVDKPSRTPLPLIGFERSFESFIRLFGSNVSFKSVNRLLVTKKPLQKKKKVIEEINK